jgi:GNAT superfamily N-acetyltransferase
VRLLIRQLEEDDQRAGFDCGDETLNDYLRRFAWQNQVRNRVGVARVAVEGSHPRLILGYYTLASASISRARLGEAGCSPLPYPEIPVILLARLAVDRRFQHRGIGELLLVHAVDRAVAVGRQVGCRGVVVDAYPKAVSWYEKFGFLALPGARPKSATPKMFLDLRSASAWRRTSPSVFRAVGR